MYKNKMKAHLPNLNALSKLCVAIACVSIMLTQSLYAGVLANAHPTSASSTKKIMPSYHWFNHIEWANEAWTGNDEPYQAIRSQIDTALVAKPQLGKVLLVQYAAEHKSHPASPTMLFRWAYLSLKLASPPLSVGEDGLDAVRNAFSSPPSPHTYNYSRLRFLLYEHSAADERLIGLGARLLKHQPNDFPVQYFYIASLRNGDAADSRVALLEVQKLIQQQPAKADLYALKGSICMRNWVEDKVAHRAKQSDADLCVAAYQDYLNRAPVNDPFRKNAEDMINWVRSR